MCGISAVIRFRGANDTDVDDLATMHRLQLHRGPDGEGAFFLNRHFHAERLDAIPLSGDARPRDIKAAVAVRRLRVSDPRAVADQPLVSSNGRVCVALNGAIYNYRELMAELTASGVRFLTSSDTEVVLQAYRQWGTACFERFAGMWGIVILDLERACLVVSRDRVGIKPLYYAIDGDRLLMASEPQAVARVQLNGPKAEPSRIVEFLSGYPARSAALSYFGGVHPVPAGTFAVLDLRDGLPTAFRFTDYWNLADYHPGGGAPPMSFEEASDRFRETLCASVAEQSLADVRVGSLLSGGLDTSTIVALWAKVAARRGTSPPETYSIAWEDPLMTERPHIDAAASKAGADSHILELRSSDVWSAIERTIQAVGQPLMGQDLIAQNYAFGFAREKGAVVLLDGSGSDEVQAGLPYYESQMVYQRLRQMEYWTAARETLAISRRYGISLPRTIKRYVVGPVMRNRNERRGLPQHAWLDETIEQAGGTDWDISSKTDASPDPSWMNALLYRETKHTNLPAVLMQSDRNAMSHSIESRYPFLDHRILELIFSLPAEYKVGFGRRKKLLFETAKGCLPKSILERKDKKMFVLLSNWMPLGEHADEIRDASRSVRLAGLPGVRAVQTRQFVDDYFTGRHRNGYAVWRIYTAALWAEQFGL